MSRFVMVVVSLVVLLLVSCSRQSSDDDSVVSSEQAPPTQAPSEEHVQPEEEPKEDVQPVELNIDVEVTPPQQDVQPKQGPPKEAASPSKEETKQFLIKKCKARMPDVVLEIFGVMHRELELDFVGDTMTVTLKESWKDVVSKFTCSVPLTDLNPSRVTIGDGPQQAYSYVKFQTTGDITFQLKHTSNQGSDDDWTRNKHNFPVKNEDAEQIAKALTHLIKLCGGKSELFED